MADQEYAAHMDYSSNPANETRDRALFMKSYSRHMLGLGRALTKIPIMGYKELDLYQLFREVVNNGGFNEVVKVVGTWSKIWKRLSNFDPSITDSSFRLRRNYERYLLEYEYFVFPKHRQQAREGTGRARQSRTQNGPRQRKQRDAARDVARLENGNPSLPLSLEGGELVVYNLGEVIPQSPYVTEKHVWPLGYRATRIFYSAACPGTLVTYTCEVVDGGDRPQFVVTAADDVHNPVVSHSPSAAWRGVIRRLCSPEEFSRHHLHRATGQSPPGSPTPMMQGASFDPMVNMLSAPSGRLPDRQKVRGAFQFGLTHPAVAQLIKELPGVPQDDSAIMAPAMGDLKRKHSEMSLMEMGGSDTDSSLSEHIQDELAQFSQNNHQQAPLYVAEPVVVQSAKRGRTMMSERMFTERAVVMRSRDEIDEMEEAVAVLHSMQSIKEEQQRQVQWTQWQQEQQQHGVWVAAAPQPVYQHVQQQVC